MFQQLLGLTLGLIESIIPFPDLTADAGRLQSAFMIHVVDFRVCRRRRVSIVSNTGRVPAVVVSG
jgi:hypothetical protein